MKKLLYLGQLLAFLFLTCAPALAQDEVADDDSSDEVLPLSERLYYSGGVGMQLGNVVNLSVSPNVGYKITSMFSVGVGLTYQYTKIKAGVYTVNGIPQSFANSEAQHIYGGRLFARVLFPGRIFLHAEYETLSIKLFNNSQRQWYGATLVGAGYSVQMGTKTSMNFMALYNLNSTSNSSLYRSQFVPRIEFAYNF